MSSGPASATSPITASVAGFTLGNVFPDPASVSFPSISKRDSAANSLIGTPLERSSGIGCDHRESVVLRADQYRCDVRVAAVDLGSNSFHLIIAEVQSGGAFEPIITEKEMLRLGDLVGRHGRIPDDAADAAVAVARRFRQLADAAGTEEMVACATSALRRAANGGEVVDRIERET